MKRNSFILLFACALLTLSSCNLFNSKTLLDEKLESKNPEEIAKLENAKLARRLDEEVQKEFGKIRQMINERKFVEAEDHIARFERFSQFSDDVEDLKQLIDLAKALPLNQTDLAIDEQRMLNEPINGLLLPRTYDTTVVIDKDGLSNEIPEGPLEKILNQKISLKVTNIPLSQLAIQLNEMDGINLADPLNIIISDEAVKDKTFSASFKDVPLHEIFAFISRNLSVEFNVTENMIWVTKSATATQGPKLETRIIKLRHGVVPQVPEGIAVTDKTAFAAVAETDSDLDDALKTFYATSTTGGSYQLFRNRNILIINDTRENIRKVEKLVEALDAPPLQVVIEAKFITVSESDLIDIGVEWKHYNGGRGGEDIDADNQTNTNVSDFITKLGALDPADAAVENVGAMTISGIIGNRSFDMLISALQTKTSTVMLSAPRVLTLNNHTARIRKGDRRYYFESYSIESVDHGDTGTTQMLVPSGKPTQLNLGITFDVKVNVGNDNETIILGLKPEIVRFVDWEEFTTTDKVTVDKVTKTELMPVKLPYVHEQSMATSATVKSGNTVILGGMVENSKIKTVKKVPLLGDIPFLGFFFRHTEETEEPTNLLIFVTATVVNNEGKYVITEEHEN